MRCGPLALVALVGCSSGDDPATDPSIPDAAGADARSIDAASASDAAPMPDAQPAPDAAAEPDAGTSVACLGFEAPARVVSAYPASGMGNVNAGAQSVSVAAADCAEVDAPLGVAAAGPEQITQLVNLVAGTTYRVRVEGVADLAFYIATACTGTSGPQTGECLLFVDTLTLTEVGTFTQPSFVAPADGVAYLVVDYFSPTPPGNGNYAFEVAAVECATSFDCPSVDAPVCDAFACVPGPSACLTNEDPSPPENGDDGPAGATDLERGEAHAAAVCEQGPLESDFYQFTAVAGETLVVDLDWTSTTTDLDVIVFDDAGTEVARAATSQRPEAAVLAVPADGDYFAQVFQFAGLGTPTTAIPYSIEVHARECTWSGDCVDAALPRCAPDLRCVAGPGSCMLDDLGVENADDGPVGATDVAAVLGGDPVSFAAAICNFPTEGSAGSIERDFYRVDVGDGERLAIALSWSGTEDLDVDVFDALGNRVGGTPSGPSPQSIDVAGLGAGTYYVAVRRDAPVGAVATAYGLSIQRSIGRIGP